MTKTLRRHSVVYGRFPGYLTAAGVAAIIALAGTACTTPAIESAGTDDDAGKGGAGGGGTGPSATGGLVIIPTSAPASTGGTTGILCNSTSTAGCRQQAPEGCGDGINNQGGIEECDDGNVLPGDGCNGNCKVERNWTVSESRKMHTESGLR
jgi:cysteine-rich repeat protein